MEITHIKKDNGRRMIVLGDNQIIKLTGKDTNGQFTLIEQYDKPGTCIPPHIHYNEDELFCILEGTIKFTINGLISYANPGDIVFCPKGKAHSWEVVGHENSKTLLTIIPAGLEIMFEELSELENGFTELNKVIEITDKYNIKFQF